LGSSDEAASWYSWCGSEIQARASPTTQDAEAHSWQQSRYVSRAFLQDNAASTSAATATKAKCAALVIDNSTSNATCIDNTRLCHCDFAKPRPVVDCDACIITVGANSITATSNLSTRFIVERQTSIVRRPKPVLNSFEEPMTAPVIDATDVRMMSVDKVYAAIGQMFGTVSRADVNQPSGKVGLNSGEILPAGVSTMVEVMQVCRTDVFGDIGSGIGNVLAQIALQTTAARCVGVEVRRKLAAQSSEIIRRFRQAFPRLSCVSIVPGDIKNMTVQMRVELQPCSVLLCNNKVFELADTLAVQNLVASLSNVGLVLLMEKFCPRCREKRCSNAFCQIWERKATIKVSVSWSAIQVEMFIFRRRQALLSRTRTLIDLVQDMHDEDSDE
jgi:hypothetical protein